MEHYKNTGGESGVAAYEIGSDYIKVKFSDGSIYHYTYLSAGSENIEHMKLLARGGNGLNAFINSTVRKNYERKEG